MLADSSSRGVPGSPGLPAKMVTQPSGTSFTSRQGQTAETIMSQRLPFMPFVSATAKLLSGGAQNKGETEFGRICKAFC